jgi:hypothetical protein
VAEEVLIVTASDSDAELSVLLLFLQAVRKRAADNIEPAEAKRIILASFIID